MKTLKNKIAAITISIFFIISMTASLMLIPNANAQTLAPGKIDIPTYSYIVVAPNPAGVGQTINVDFWVDQPPPTASGNYGDRWQNLNVKVTDPNGDTQTLGPFISDDTGGTHTDFTPTTTGNYTFQMTFSGQTLAGANPPPTGELGPQFIGDYYEPSVSNVATLTVQTTAIPSAPQAPLPTSFWTRPIYSINDYWNTISGNWLGLTADTFSITGGYNATGNYNPYTVGPETAHILWTMPAALGGLVGGEYGATSTSNFYSTRQYDPNFDPVIMDGILYFDQFPNAGSNPSNMVAVDLKTGKTLWTMDISTPTQFGGGAIGSQSDMMLRTGQILDYTSINQYGSQAYLWMINYNTETDAAADIQNATGIYPPPSTYTYSMYNAMTGSYVLSIIGGPSVQFVSETGGSFPGSLLGYYVNSTTHSLVMWNSTAAILQEELVQGAAAPGSNYRANLYWRPPQNAVIPWSYGIQWSVPLPTTVAGNPLGVSLGISGIGSDILMTGSVASGASFQSGYQIEAGFDLNTGAQLWITNRTETTQTRLASFPPNSGVYTEVNLQTSVINGYSVTTGTQLWTTQLTGADGGSTNAYDNVGGYEAVPANGVLYLWGFGGDIWAINLQTGKIIWYTNTEILSGAAGSNTPYGVWPLWTFTVGTVAGGMLYVPEGHQYSPPLFRGASQLAINCTNGQPVWSITAFDVTSAPAISDGVMTTLNSYDEQVYAYGMGPTKTTVSAPNIGATTATPITITGSVTDISAGASQTAVASNFPNGLPCVSDASMTQFMESVYMQQPEPHNVTGVPVTFAVIDANGNYRTIGSTTTNGLGDYSFIWKPDITGNYTVYATFAGTQSYYGSTASTGFYASSPATTSAPTATPLSGVATQTTLEYIGVAIIIVIIIGIAVLALLVTRRRP